MRPEFPLCPRRVGDIPAPVEPGTPSAAIPGAAVPGPTPVLFVAPETLVRRVYSRPAGDLPAACTLVG